MKRNLAVLTGLLVAWVAQAVGPFPGADLVFIPDPGLRMDDASNPAAALLQDGRVVLFYDQRLEPPRQLVSVSGDGLTFGAGSNPATAGFVHPFTVALPDGRFRRYLWSPGAAGFVSETSSDGLRFAADPGIRYSAQPSDKGAVGVYDNYFNPDGSAVLLYIGDMFGTNNIRRAVSPPGDLGMRFVFDDGNVLGDVTAGGGSRSFVDPKSILLPDGRRRLFVMRPDPDGGPRTAGVIWSFISRDGRAYSPEPDARLRPTDFRDATLLSLNDPVVVRLPDGRYRMYVAALVERAAGEPRWAIVSATAVP
jgi:hypothetical protein